jgi:hypothetical protein
LRAHHARSYRKERYPNEGLFHSDFPSLRRQALETLPRERNLQAARSARSAIRSQRGAPKQEFTGELSCSAAPPPLTVFAVTPNFVASVPKFARCSALHGNASGRDLEGVFGLLQYWVFHG